MLVSIRTIYDALARQWLIRQPPCKVTALVYLHTTLSPSQDFVLPLDGYCRWFSRPDFIGMGLPASTVLIVAPLASRYT